ncbi:hypothetical protein ES703_89204 [subsurface metagenome]
MNGNGRIEDLICAEKLAAYCGEVWGCNVEPEAAAYFIRLMARRIAGFTPYLPKPKPVKLRHVYRAASLYFA